MPDRKPATLADRIRKRAQKAQRDGNAGAAVKLHILASEAKTVRER
ncbi:MAG: hypothetical protein J7496_08790 [Novosphingobium sp.]|nr:hypothetical protein [Novosphingobium sp.]